MHAAMPSYEKMLPNTVGKRNTRAGEEIGHVMVVVEQSKQMRASFDNMHRPRGVMTPGEMPFCLPPSAATGGYSAFQIP